MDKKASSSKGLVEVLPEDQETGEFWNRWNRETNLIERISCFTGEVVAVQSEPLDLSIDDAERFQEVTLRDGRKVLLQRGVPLDRVENYKSRWPYSSVLADIICQFVEEEGLSLHKVALKPQMPPVSTLYRWKRMEPEFSEKLKAAQEARADLMADRAEEVALNASKETASSDTLQHAHFRWSAETSNPEVYGKKTKISGDSASPLQFIIQTGVPEAIGESTLEREVGSEADSLLDSPEAVRGDGDESV